MPREIQHESKPKILNRFIGKSLLFWPKDTTHCTAIITDKYLAILIKKFVRPGFFIAHIY